MIAFDLACACGCLFEGWFPSREACDQQMQAGELACPACGSSQVRRVLSPVALGGSRSWPAEADEDGGGDAEERQEAARLLGLVQEYVRDNFEDVGPRLATEALKMHYGVIPAKRIRGQATAQEEEALEREGIELLTIPMPAKNKAN
ncbi:MAG: DUF1178 family protein [Thermodesulfobacteriota bacterium]